LDKITENLYNLYNEINNTKDIFVNELKGIKINDIVVTNMGSGKVIKIINDEYIIKDNKEEKTLKTTFENVIEHYPINGEFKTNNFIKDDQNHNEVIKIFRNKSLSEINKLIDNNKTLKFYIIDNINEIHIVRVNDMKNTKILIDGLLIHLIKKGLLKNELLKIKLFGNDKFIIMKNVTEKTHNLLIKTLLLILK
jgi:hypothetical protein